MSKNPGRLGAVPRTAQLPVAVAVASFQGVGPCEDGTVTSVVRGGGPADQRGARPGTGSSLAPGPLARPTALCVAPGRGRVLAAGPPATCTRGILPGTRGADGRPGRLRSPLQPASLSSCFPPGGWAGKELPRTTWEWPGCGDHGQTQAAASSRLSPFSSQRRGQTNVTASPVSWSALPPLLCFAPG